jgi:hypothetical protein
MTTRIRSITILAFLGAAASDCLLKDESHTWYVDTAGRVTWSVTEKDVRSDAQAAHDRDAEESAYWSSVRSEMHAMARGLRVLGAMELRTRALRAEVPFTVVTEGRFQGLDELGQRLISQAGLTGSSVVRNSDNTWEWSMTARDPHVTSEHTNVDEGLQALVASLDRLQVVLVAGRFESAAGFDLSPDRRIASVKSDVAVGGEEPTVTIILRWK